MQFDISNEQKAIDATLRRLLMTRLPQPRVLEVFTAGIFDHALWQEIANLGLGAILVPVEQGGLGMDLLTLAIVSEALGYCAAPLPVTSNALAAWLIACYGNDAFRAEWLEPLSSGARVAAFAVDGPGGWLPSQWMAESSPMTGEKYAVEWASHADLLIVGAKNGLFAVSPDAPGVTITLADAVDRTRPTATVRLESCAATLITSDAEVCARLADALLILLAADACGAAARARELAVDYAKTRMQFGRSIGSFQAVKHQLATMAIEGEPCRQLYWFAAHAWDALPDRRAWSAALAKAHIGDVAVRIARAAIEAHGGIGYTWDYPLHVWLKRAMYDRSALGVPTIHRERAASFAGW